VPPDRVVDVLALMGDSIDNVPGVPGIGEKGAVGLIREWGSLEACLENAEKIPNKRQREALVEHGRQAQLSKDLVRIATDLAVDVDLDHLAYRGADRPKPSRCSSSLDSPRSSRSIFPKGAGGPRPAFARSRLSPSWNASSPRREALSECL